MKMEALMLKVTFLTIFAVVLLISAVNPIYAMNLDEEKENSTGFSLKKRDSNSDPNDDSDNWECSSSSDDDEYIQLVKAEIWGPTAEKLLIEVIQNRRSINTLEHENDLRMLLDAAQTGTINPATRTLITVLMFFGTKEAMEAASKLNYAIALNSSFRFKTRENAVEDLETMNLPENKKLAYEAYTALAMDKSLTFEQEVRGYKIFFIRMYYG